MKNSNDKTKSKDDTQKVRAVKKPLPSGTVTTTRSSIFELGSKNENKKD